MKAADLSLGYRWQCHYLKWCEKKLWLLTGFPVCGTKLLCVTDSIVFFIEYNTLENRPSRSFTSSFIMIRITVKFTILVRRERAPCDSRVNDYWASSRGNFCCYTLSLSRGSACSFLSLVLLSLNCFSKRYHSILTYAKLLKRQKTLTT